MSPRAGLPASERQRRLRLVAAELPPVESDEPPFLRPPRRTRARRPRRAPLARLVLALEVAGGVLVALFALWGAYGRVMAAERLKVARVEVEGSRFLSEREVRDLLGPAVGENILALDIDRLTARLRVSPWVAEATVARRLPDTLRVEVRERAPLALAELERLYLMDGQGVLIDVYGPRTAGFDLPIVRGLARADEAARRERARRAGELLSDLGPLASEVSEVEVDARGGVEVVLRGPGERLVLGRPPYRARVQAFLGLREELLRRCPEAEWFDLRFRDRIVARQGGRWPEPPAPTTAAVPPAAPAPSPAPPAAPEGTAAAPPGPDALEQSRPATGLEAVGEEIPEARPDGSRQALIGVR